MRKKRFPITLVCAIVVVLVVVGGLVLQWFLPGPAIEVARDTTYLTTPLAADGLPDYGAYLLAQQREGVTPENNGAIPFLQAMWPAGLDAEGQRLVCKELGMAIPEREGLTSLWSNKPLREELNTWYQVQLSNAAKVGEHPVIQPDQYDGLSYAEDLAERPWTRDQIPLLAEWLDQHAEQFELLHEAAVREQSYLPPPEALKSTSDRVYASYPIDYIVVHRDAARFLFIRAMLYLGEGDVAKAWDDVRSIYAIAEFPPSDTFVSYMISIAIDGMADATAIEVLAHPDLDSELARKILDFQLQRAQRDRLGTLVGESERIYLINLSLPLASQRGAMDSMEEFGLLDLGAVAHGSIDWNVFLRKFNDWCDRAAAAYAAPDRIQRRASLSALEHEAAAKSEASGGRTLVAYLNPKTRSDLIADSLMAEVVPSAVSLLDTEERANSQRTLHTTAAALALYRVEQGEYPDTLNALVPDILPAVPEDLFTGQPLLYRRTADGYLLYSVGPNGADDGGSHQGWQVYQGYRINTPEDEQAARKVLGLTPLPEPPENPDPFAEVTPPANPADVPLTEQIPAGADDMSLRVPLLRPEVPLRQP